MIANNWSMVASGWLTAAASAADGLSSVFSCAAVVSKYFCGTPHGARPLAWRHRPRIPSAGAVRRFGHQRSLWREINRCSSPSALAIAGISVAQVFVDIAYDGLVGVQQPEGRGLIGAQVVHRLRTLGEASAMTPIRQPVSGIPGVEREADHHAERCSVRPFSMAAPQIPPI